ncbi:MAG TPA: hypothetical protein G4O02_16960 [Caldilineae bacterium]|nr:hypothetical protein [Caldilineae bacterium]
MYVPLTCIGDADLAAKADRTCETGALTKTMAKALVVMREEITIEQAMRWHEMQERRRDRTPPIRNPRLREALKEWDRATGLMAFGWSSHRKGWTRRSINGGR